MYSVFLFDGLHLCAVVLQRACSLAALLLCIGGSALLCYATHPLLRMGSPSSLPCASSPRRPLAGIALCRTRASTCSSARPLEEVELCGRPPPSRPATWAAPRSALHALPSLEDELHERGVGRIDGGKGLLTGREEACRRPWRTHTMRSPRCHTHASPRPAAGAYPHCTRTWASESQARSASTSARHAG